MTSHASANNSLRVETSQTSCRRTSREEGKSSATACVDIRVIGFNRPSWAGPYERGPVSKSFIHREHHRVKHFFFWLLWLDREHHRFAIADHRYAMKIYN